MSTQPEDSVDDMSYEQARAELREIVAKLESGGQPLEESLLLWQRGEQLATVCQRWLDGARTRLEAAIATSDAPDD
ncbi:exodeoxyribonuclease VII small subunit [Jatrophihabitans telluris]|uniref:Exodeoxyribonuclease 7 small subunit n=2 Tax=Jatrophihabitans telluris TaxID=2038343 RepID=A0ABY4QWB8_9ACTN|nr:exodeoxyribonuclease VII small subunit [Jatrophihabitans telluris]UQX87758.1 exodeoxyribonuclease VII small subunit [Jatrophihabitans telluris]